MEKHPQRVIWYRQRKRANACEVRREPNCRLKCTAWSSLSEQEAWWTTHPVSPGNSMMGYDRRWGVVVAWCCCGLEAETTKIIQKLLSLDFNVNQHYETKCNLCPVWKAACCPAGSWGSCHVVLDMNRDSMAEKQQKFPTSGSVWNSLDNQLQEFWAAFT